MSEVKSCKNCAKSFEITNEDLAFYDKISPVFEGKKFLISPQNCPDCRQQRRLSWRNERNLYKRKCDLSKKGGIFIYSADKPFTVYSQDVWQGDQWDPLKYGRDFDFNRPFFAQFGDLMMAVPHQGMGFQTRCENSEYTTYQNDSKNCYLTFGSGFMEDCAYANWTYYAKNALDILGSEKLELCYETVDCNNMYSCDHCQNSSGLTDCGYCYDCHNCQNCFGCVGIRRKQFCFLNKQLSKEEYQAKMTNLNLAEFLKEFQKLKLITPHRANFQLNCENCSGDQLTNCKNVNGSYIVTQSQDSKFQFDVLQMKDSYDCTRTGISELLYEDVGGGWYYNTKAAVACESIAESYYVYCCYHSKNLFGCFGLKRKEYCILNKKYSKEEYEKLVPKIIDHMQKIGEWSEFFPMNLSPFAYNETLAQEYYPKTKDEVLKHELSWKDPDLKDYLAQTYQGSYKIDSVSDLITKEILACKAMIDDKPCGKNYRINFMELKFYKQRKIDLPEKCPDCRHKNRLAMRNSRKLWSRNCGKCGMSIQTSYAPDRPEIIYCEKCYLEAVY